MIIQKLLKKLTFYNFRNPLKTANMIPSGDSSFFIVTANSPKKYFSMRFLLDPLNFGKFCCKIRNNSVRHSLASCC